MHIKHLPRESAYVRSLQGDAAYWDEPVELLAQAVDAIREQSYYLLRVNGNDAEPHTTVKRPGRAQAEQPSGSLADFNALIGG